MLCLCVHLIIFLLTSIYFSADIHVLSLYKFIVYFTFTHFPYNISMHGLTIVTVSCGMRAASCARCSLGRDGVMHGSSWCNGDWHWRSERCAGARVDYGDKLCLLIMVFLTVLFQARNHTLPISTCHRIILYLLESFE